MIIKWESSQHPTENPLHNRGITSSEFRRQWDPSFLGGHWPSFHGDSVPPLFSVPFLQHWGRSWTQSDLERGAALVMVLPHCGLSPVRGWAGNLSVFCRHVAVEKCVPSAQTRPSQERREHVELALACVRATPPSSAPSSFDICTRMTFFFF